MEAFAYSDNNLHTAIGRSDGKVYETLFDWAKNKNDVNKPENQERIREETIKLKEISMTFYKSKL